MSFFSETCCKPFDVENQKCNESVPSLLLAPMITTHETISAIYERWSINFVMLYSRTRTQDQISMIDTGCICMMNAIAGSIAPVMTHWQQKDVSMSNCKSVSEGAFLVCQNIYIQRSTNPKLFGYLFWSYCMCVTFLRIQSKNELSFWSKNNWLKQVSDNIFR